MTNGGVHLDNGGHLRVIFSGSFQAETLPPELQTPTVDNQILALALHEQRRERHPVVVTKDINLRIKAHAVGLRAEIYETDKVSFDQLYSGPLEMDIDGDLVDRFYQDHTIDMPASGLYPHQCVTFRNRDNLQQAAIGRLEQRPYLCSKTIQGQPTKRPYHLAKRRALTPRRSCQQPAINQLGLIVDSRCQNPRLLAGILFWRS